MKHLGETESVCVSPGSRVAYQLPGPPRWPVPAQTYRPPDPTHSGIPSALFLDHSTGTTSGHHKERILSLAASI